jgi:hypothetical protein
MDIQKFQDSRERELDSFQKTYSDLKSQYSQLSLSAIQETDPEKQQGMIQEILELNAELSTQLRNILGILNKGDSEYNTTTIDQLTNDLIKYQKQYKEIVEAKDRSTTLKLIHATTTKNLEDASQEFNIYLIILALLCLVIVFLVIRTSWMTSVFESITSVTSQS